MDIDHGIVGTISAILGALFTKILTHRQKNIEIKHSEDRDIRLELRADILNMQQKIERISMDLDSWREKYYRLADENVQLRSRCLRLELEVEDLRHKVLVQTTPECELPPGDPDKRMQ